MSFHGFDLPPLRGRVSTLKKFIMAKLKEEYKTAKIYGKAAGKEGVIDLRGASQKLIDSLAKNKDLAFLFEKPKGAKK